MIYHLKIYFIALFVFFAIDLIWLTLIARTFYQKHIGYIMSPSPNWYAAIIFYLLFILGLVVFVLVPGLEAGSLKMTLIRAALFGLVTYATYDLTNLATIKDWPLIVTIVDIVWGISLSLLVSLPTFFISRLLS
jgi:uncharacterized membrane protein